MGAHVHAILSKMDFFSHCPECGALLVTVPGGALCAHCGFEQEDPDEAVVSSFWKALERRRGSYWGADDQPEVFLGEAA